MGGGWILFMTAATQIWAFCELRDLACPGAVAGHLRELDMRVRVAVRTDGPGGDPP
jgi:hypothetical protein